MVPAVLLVLLPRCPAAPPPRCAAQTSLTIYNDGRVLMRRTLPVAVPRGSSVQRLTLGALDPATVFSLDSTVTLMGVSYDGAVDEGSALRRSVGKRLVFRLPPGPAGSPRYHQRPGAGCRSAQAATARWPHQLHPTGNPTISAGRRRGGAHRESLGPERRRDWTSSGWATSPAVLPGRRAIRWCWAEPMRGSPAWRSSHPSRSGPRTRKIHLLAGEVGQAQQKGHRSP